MLDRPALTLGLGFAMLTTSLVVVSCASHPPSSSRAVPSASIAAPDASLVPPEASASASASAAVSAEPVAIAPPAACPAGMILIDGDYCTDLQLTCKKSHYAAANKKTVCEEFAEESTCTGEKEHRRYCIDTYEYPNQKGANPEVMNDFHGAQKKCAALGKRVCTESEWTMACEGPSYKPYPYGYVRDPNKCRGDRPYRTPKKQKSGILLTHSKDKDAANAEIQRLWDAVPSGSQPDCVSDYGVFDMPGNADELAASEGKTKQYGSMKVKGGIDTLNGQDLYDNVTTGGPWVEGVRNQCRPKIYTHDEQFSYYYLSFRCCAEADGKPTDPRSPRQIRRGQKSIE
ncbi:MAG: SUMF1/EgtB/PvdO family nonheme iron enzyme [Polyangiaceae bacterium]